MAAANKRRRVDAVTGVLIPYNMVWEILTWLPTKSLMRFKAVSKLWLSTILDPNFARARRAIFRGLLAMYPDPYPTGEESYPTRDFFFANFDGGESNNASEVNFSFQFSIPDEIRGLRTSNIMNGIICFYDRHVSKLFNIATREIINLPESRYTYKNCRYHLVFDPIQSVYKLLKICRVDLDWFFLSIKCEILTLGVDLSWRSIQSPPHGISIMSHGICVDGVLHLMTMEPPFSFSYERGHYTFNVAGEKFQAVNYPKHIILHLPTFGIIPVLAKCYGFNPNQKQIVIAVADYREGSWTSFNEYTLDMGDLDMKDLLQGDLDMGNLLLGDLDMGGYLFDSFDNGELLIVRGSLPNGNLMLISNAERVGTDSGIYLFDKTKNYLQKYLLRFPAAISGGIFWYEENIVSLKTLSDFSMI